MTRGWAPTLAEHLRANDEDSPICFECGEMYELRHGSSDTGFCDSCAQEKLIAAPEYLALLAQSNSTTKG
jgi:hypothetical protein